VVKELIWLFTFVWSILKFFCNADRKRSGNGRQVMLLSISRGRNKRSQV
jgi:hypothetical protein